MLLWDNEKLEMRLPAALQSGYSTPGPASDPLERYRTVWKQVR
jgi:hypothetical protein